jgi:predicted RNA binding protein YcfA (HicA-like mRNA interferase family)
MNPRKTLAKARNNPADVRFSDLLGLVVALGWQADRTSGSHQIFRHPLGAERLNLQPGKDGKAKPYQVRQILDAIDRHGLTLGD